MLEIIRELHEAAMTGFFVFGLYSLAVELSLSFSG